MRMLSLFAGIGGIDLAAQWAGIETVAFCEIDPFCQKVLKKHWPGVPIFEDVRKLRKQTLIDTGVIGDGSAIDIICAGYPCQPFSHAGERKGKEDDRHLWPEVSRLLQEIRPTWFLGENVAGHVTLGLDDVLSDLERIGYAAEPFIIPACAVGASHRRDRVFVLAHSNSKHVEGYDTIKIQREPEIQRCKYLGSIEEWARRAAVYEPKLLRTFNGIPNQVDRIRALGNAVVPQQVYPILWAMKQIHDLAA
jgi:DNA (cytosine-5)-methyltransferase 1